MDLGFALPSSDNAVPLPSLDLAALMTVLAERQAAAFGANDAAAAEPADEPLLAPRGGAFSAAMAARLSDWRRE